MKFELPPLPYAKNALEPVISADTLEVHYGKHHKTYVEKLNKLIAGTPYENMELREIMLASKGKDKKVYNNAAQNWNHTFFWNCMAPSPKQMSNGLNGVLTRGFGSVEEFQKKFNTEAADLFGSGWVWLVQDSSGDLLIRGLKNANNPINDGEIPLLVLDVWEHAYYLDYKNERPKFAENFWKIVNWEFVEAELNGSGKSQPELVANLN